MRCFRSIRSYEQEDIIHAAGDICKCPNYLFQINIDTDGAFVEPEEGARPQMGNLRYADTRWTGFRDPAELQETYADLAILDGRIAGYYDSVMFSFEGTLCSPPLLSRQGFVWGGSLGWV